MILCYVNHLLMCTYRHFAQMHIPVYMPTNVYARVYGRSSGDSMLRVYTRGRLHAPGIKQRFWFAVLPHHPHCKAIADTPTVWCCEQVSSQKICEPQAKITRRHGDLHASMHAQTYDRFSCMHACIHELVTWTRTHARLAEATKRNRPGL